jgi:cytochrome P450
MDEDRVFVCRFAMRPCYVLASNSLVKQLLNDKSSHESYNGLKDFFFGLFGQNVMFSEAAEAEKMRQIMIPLMTPEALTDYKPIMQQLVSTWILRDLSGCDPVILYDQFKKFATMLTLKLFLGLDGEEAEEMSKLATTHWHGIISVPLNVKLSFLMSSSYRKAVHAKNQLLALIEKKLASKDSPFLAKFEEEARNGGINDLEEVKNNILLITCALIPKALASILTSFVDSSGLW